MARLGKPRWLKRSPCSFDDASNCIGKTTCKFTIRFAEGVAQDLKKIPVFYRNRILDAIEQQLTITSGTETRNSKPLMNLTRP